MKYTSTCTVEPQYALKVKSALAKAVSCITECPTAIVFHLVRLLQQIILNTADTFVIGHGIFICLHQRYIMFITKLMKSRETLRPWHFCVAVMIDKWTERQHHLNTSDDLKTCVRRLLSRKMRFSLRAGLQNTVPVSPSPGSELRLARRTSGNRLLHVLGFYYNPLSR